MVRRVDGSSAAPGSKAGSAKLQFEPVETRKESVSLIDEAVKTHASTLIWTRNREVVIRTQVAVSEPAAKVLVVRRPAGFRLKDFVDHLKELDSDQCYFSISLVRANIFFRTSYLSALTHGLRFRWPEQIFKVQRRKDLRLKIAQTRGMMVELRDPGDQERLVRLRLIDISASGLAFSISGAEIDRFRAGTLIEEISVKIEGQLVTTSARVKYARRLEKNALNYQVGVEFENLTAAHQQRLARFVFHETRKLFSKLL